MKKHFYCLRCGIQKIKGYWENGCSAWGSNFDKHIWKLQEEDGFKIMLTSPHQLEKYWEPGDEDLA
jgi:hypothetical protein